MSIKFNSSILRGEKINSFKVTTFPSCYVTIETTKLKHERLVRNIYEKLIKKNSSKHTQNLCKMKALDVFRTERR